MTVRLFVDFDGTVTQEDVGNAFFRRFGGQRCDEIVRMYREGRISAAGCYTLEAEAMGAFDPVEVTSYVRRFAIDETFHSLVRFARERGYSLTIVSDGLDLYIREILAANGLDGVGFFANRAEFVPTGESGRSKLKLEFPLQDEECTRCACCKRNLMLTQSADEDVIVLVGEGFSDMCPARFADVVFAKKELQTHCQRENISYAPYADFNDVVEKLTEMTRDGKRLRKRTRAEVRRRTAFREE